MPVPTPKDPPTQRYLSIPTLGGDGPAACKAAGYETGGRRREVRLHDGGGDYRVLVLAGCAVRQAYMPDGRKGYVVQCSSHGQFGAVLSWNGCYRHAGETCGARGYDILSQNGEDHIDADGGSGQYTTINTGMTRTMIIRCKGDKQR